MKKKRKPNIKKLKYPLWYKIIYYVGSILAPIVLLMVQGFRSPHQGFRITFAVISIALIGWVFVRKFVIGNLEQKMTNEKSALEHDYAIECGNTEKIKYLWFSNELWLNLVNFVHIALIGSLIMLVAIGIQNAAIKVKGTSFIIMILYLIVYAIKFVYIIVQRDKFESKEDEELDDELDKDTEVKEETKEEQEQIVLINVNKNN